MADNWSDKISRGLDRVARKAGGTAAASTDTVRRATVHSRAHALDAARTFRDGNTAGKVARMARAAAASGPVAEVAKICGRAGIAGAVVDGAVGGMHAVRHMNAGRIDGKQALKHTAAEAGCGFVTSSAGTAGTIAVYMVTGAMGPAALAAGMGASVGSRYLYRKVVGETLPDDGDDARQEDNSDEAGTIEEIGPKPMD